MFILCYNQKLYNMIDPIMAMASITPIEKIVEEIKYYATKYTLTGEEEELQNLEAMCMMLLSKRSRLVIPCKNN